MSGFIYLYRKWGKKGGGWELRTSRINMGMKEEKCGERKERKWCYRMMKRIE
jgi:hypothetical protein